MERMVNVQILYLLAILLALSVGCAIGSTVRNHFAARDMWYLMLENTGFSASTFFKDILTFILTLNNLIPIS